MEMLGITETSRIAERLKEHLLKEYQDTLTEMGVQRGEMVHTEIAACESEIHRAAWKIAGRLVEACNSSERAARLRGATIAHPLGNP